MSDIRKLMDEYKLKINDPSYVAPKELRNHDRRFGPAGSSQSNNPAMPVATQTQTSPQTDSLSKEQAQAFFDLMAKSDPRSVDVPKGFDPEPNQNELDRRFYNTSQRKELAQKLGVDMSTGIPWFSDDQEKEWLSVESNDDESKLNERQKMFLNLMTDEDDNK